MTPGSDTSACATPEASKAKIPDASTALCLKNNCIQILVFPLWAAVKKEKAPGLRFLADQTPLPVWSRMAPLL
jgi:hypothetical protein